MKARSMLLVAFKLVPTQAIDDEQYDGASGEYFFGDQIIGLAQYDCGHNRGDRQTRVWGNDHLGVYDHK